jgi:YHS domain-containing protein
MTRHLFTFLGTFLVGALIALAARTARHQPHADQPAVSHAEAKGQHAALPTSTTPAPAATTAEAPVNTVCAICGMKVDPALPTATYQGKTIGFGCRMCPPKFKAAPDKYGPTYLRNEIIKN